MVLPVLLSSFLFVEARFFLLDVVEIQGIFGKFSPGTGWGAVVVAGIVVVVAPVVVVVVVVVVARAINDYMILQRLKSKKSTNKIT